MWSQYRLPTGITIYALQDAAFNVTSLMREDAGGVWQVVQRHVLDPYGDTPFGDPTGYHNADWSIVSESGAPVQHWRYLHHGGFKTTDGLYHFRHRSYDPYAGKWLQRDPAGYIDGLNLYEYVGSNPVNNVDPSGQGALLTGLLIYAGIQTMWSIGEMTVEYKAHDVFGDPNEQFSWGGSFIKNLGVNLATGWIGGNIRSGGKIAVISGKLASRKLLAFGIRQSIEISGDTAYDMYYNNYGLGEALAYNTVGSLLGEGVGRGIGAGLRRLGRSTTGQVVGAYVEGFGRGLLNSRSGQFALGMMGGNVRAMLGDAHQAGRRALSSLRRMVDDVPESLLGGASETFVYFGRRGGRNVHAGITNDVLRRQREHGIRFVIQELNPGELLTRRQARAIEQVLIDQNPLFDNIKNSISVNRDWYQDAVAWGEAWLKLRGII